MAVCGGDVFGVTACGREMMGTHDLARFIADVLHTDETGAESYVDSSHLSRVVVDGKFDLLALAMAIETRLAAQPRVLP